MESFGLSQKDAQFRNKWRRRIVNIALISSRFGVTVQFMFKKTQKMPPLPVKISQPPVVWKTGMMGYQTVAKVLRPV